MRYRTPAAILACAVLVAGCGSSSSTNASRNAKNKSVATSTHTAAHGWTGFGAPLAAFASQHPKATSGPCTSGCYGSPESDSQGALWQFTTLMSGGPSNRVYGYTQAFSVGTSISSVEAAVLALMPAGTHPVGGLVVEHSSTGRCGLWNLQSKTLARWFATPKIGDPKGQVGVTFSEVGSNGYVYKPTNVTAAAVQIVPATTTTAC